MNIGKVISVFREIGKISVEDVALALGVTEGYVKSCEKNLHTEDAIVENSRFIQQFCTQFNISLEVLVYLSYEKTDFETANEYFNQIKFAKKFHSWMCSFKDLKLEREKGDNDEVCWSKTEENENAADFNLLVTSKSRNVDEAAVHIVNAFQSRSTS